MCGIVGYIGSDQAAPVLLDGLARLSYRGYDSAGVAILNETGHIHVRKAKGKLENLEALLEKCPLEGCVGIGHTRWATHGEPSDLNAHPHTDVQGGIAVVHNGIIENHASLRRFLEAAGVPFVSETDTEVIAHLLASLYRGDMHAALKRAMGMLRGSYALGVICDREPNTLYCARNDSPLVIGMRQGECFLASDVPALLRYTRDVIFLQDKEIGVLDRSGVTVYDAYGNGKTPAFFHVDWNVTDAEKGGYDHYMLKEIHEQPTALKTTFAARDTGDFGWLPFTKEQAVQMGKVTIAACGTAYHAGVMAKAFFERLARVATETEFASEYRYRSPMTATNELFIAVSQSGETADTLAALRQAKRLGARTLAICNAVGSTLAREADDTLYTYAGPEIAVASTKAYTTQVELLLLVAAALGALRGALSPADASRLTEKLRALPRKAEETLKTERDIQRFTARMMEKKHVFFVGRGLDYALCMEASLKLKEVSYLFSEAYPAGELKHGPIALIQAGSLLVACVTQPETAEKTVNNLREAKARGAHVLAVCCRSLKTLVAETADDCIVIPDAPALIASLLAVIPLQLFAYNMAVARGRDVDKPRNLAKSVTVE